MNRLLFVPSRYGVVSLPLFLSVFLTVFLLSCAKEPSSPGLEDSAVLEDDESRLPKTPLTALKTQLNTNSRKDASNEPQEKITYTEIEWTDLLPDEDLEALENPPTYLEDIEDGSTEDRIANQLKAGVPADVDKTMDEPVTTEDRYQQALSSTNVRPEFNERPIRIPGFIVPLEFDDQQTITTFFLVPFFGACIHLPPPPPNQIIYAEYEPGIRLEALFDPFWINGTLYTNLIENDMAIAAYSLMVSSIEPYYETNQSYENVQIEELESIEEEQ